MIISVIRKSDGIEMSRYAAQAITALDDYPFSDFDHVEYVDEPIAEGVNPAKWRIHVGSFFDRFGGAKLPILSSDNALVQAMITDSSVRQYIGLYERRTELTQMLDLLQTLVSGISLDVNAILDTEPTEAELWHGE